MTTPSLRGWTAHRRAARALAVAFVAAALVLPIAREVGAAPHAKKPAVDVKGIGEKLKSDDAAQVIEGLVEAKAGGADAAPLAPSIDEIVRRGASNEAMRAAFEALGAIGLSSSSVVIRPYVKHRVEDVRRAAVKALVTTKGPDALAAFKDGLKSVDPQVRGLSATGLGDLGATEAVPDLFVALDHDVPEAAAAIGKLCAPDECEKFADKLGKVEFDRMTSGFDPILFRKPPLAEDELVRIVERLRDIGTPEAGSYLGNVQGRWPKKGSPRVKAAIDSAVSSLPPAKGS